MRAWVPVVVVVVAGTGCKEKPAEQALAPEQQVAKHAEFHLKSLEKDLGEAEAARRANPNAVPTACAGANISLAEVTRAGAPNGKELQARYDAACGAVAVAKLGLPAEIEAPAKAVEAALADARTKHAAKDFDGADLACMMVIDDMEKLQASSHEAVKQLRFEADKLCNLLVPLDALEAAVGAATKAMVGKSVGDAPPPGCAKARVENAFMLLAFGKRLTHDAVWPVVKKWNETCPQAVLEAK